MYSQAVETLQRLFVRLEQVSEFHLHQINKWFPWLGALREVDRRWLPEPLWITTVVMTGDRACYHL